MKSFPVSPATVEMAFPKADRRHIDRAIAKTKSNRPLDSLDLFDHMFGTLGVKSSGDLYYLDVPGRHDPTMYYDEFSETWGISTKAEILSLRRLAATGLYGFTKSTETTCTASIRKLEREALKVAKRAYKKDPRVASFLATHASRNDSLPAKILVECLKTLGPKFSKTSAKKSLYGYHQKTVKVGLSACSDIRFEAGVVANAIYARKSSNLFSVSGFYTQHAEEGKNLYARIMAASLPAENGKQAAHLSDEWLILEAE